jgi:hypothetical protein
MEKWEEKCNAARLNIVRVADECCEHVGYFADKASIPEAKVAGFISGLDILSFGEMLRLCEAMQTPIWAMSEKCLNPQHHQGVFLPLEMVIRQTLVAETPAN